MAVTAMAHMGLNVPATALLPTSFYRRLIRGTTTISDARHTLEHFDFAANGGSLTHLADLVPPDMQVWASPVLSESLQEMLPLIPGDATPVRTSEELSGAIRASWLSLLSEAMLQALRDHHIPEQQFLSSAAMAVIVQHTDGHSGLMGRTWSASPEAGEPAVRVQCSLDTAKAEKPVWNWLISKSGTILDHPSPVPADEALILQTAQLATSLALRTGPCVLDWTWDGQELCLQSAVPVFVPKETTVYSRRLASRLAGQPLTPLAGDLLVDLVQHLYQDLATLFIPRETPVISDSAARLMHGRLYMNKTLTGNLLEQLGLPRETISDLLDPQTGPFQQRISVQTFFRHPGTTRALGIIQSAGLRFDTWVSRNSPRLACLDDTAFAAWTGEQTMGRLEHLQTLLHPLLLNMTLLLILSSLRTRALQQALERCNISDRLDDALRITSDTAGLNPWSHLDELAATITDETASRAATFVSNGEPGQAIRELCTDTTFNRELEAFLHTFWFFRTTVADIGSPTLLERKDILPTLLLRVRETGAAQRVASAADPEAWPSTLSVPESRLLRRAYDNQLRTSVVIEKSWYYFAKALSGIRLLVLHRGDLLVQAGCLNMPEDVFFLHWDELGSATDLRTAAAERTAAFQLDTASGVPKIVVVKTSSPPAGRETSATISSSASPK